MNRIVSDYFEQEQLLREKIEHILSVLHPGFPHRGVIYAPNLMFHHDPQTNELNQEVVAEIDTYETLGNSTNVIIPIDYFDMTDIELRATGAFLF